MLDCANMHLASMQQQQQQQQPPPQLQQHAQQLSLLHQQLQLQQQNQTNLNTNHNNHQQQQQYQLSSPPPPPISSNNSAYNAASSVLAYSQQMHAQLNARSPRLPQLPPPPPSSCLSRQSSTTIAQQQQQATLLLRQQQQQQQQQPATETLITTADEQDKLMRWTTTTAAAAVNNNNNNAASTTTTTTSDLIGYYFGSISRETAEWILRNSALSVGHAHGAYLLRSSGANDDFVLSLMVLSATCVSMLETNSLNSAQPLNQLPEALVDAKVLHYKIVETEDSFVALHGQAGDEKFATIDELIEKAQGVATKPRWPIARKLLESSVLPPTFWGLSVEQVRLAIVIKARQWNFALPSIVSQKQHLTSTTSDDDDDDDQSLNVNSQQQQQQQSTTLNQSPTIHKKQQQQQQPSTLNNETIRTLIYKSLHEFQPWFHGRISRDEAERRLSDVDARDGRFLVRERDNFSYALCISHKKTVKHYRIDILATGELAIQDGKKFTSLMALVSHYTLMNDGLWCALTEPVVRPIKQQQQQHQQLLFGNNPLIHANNNPNAQAILSGDKLKLCDQQQQKQQKQTNSSINNSNTLNKANGVNSNCTCSCAHAQGSEQTKQATSSNSIVANSSLLGAPIKELLQTINAKWTHLLSPHQSLNSFLFGAQNPLNSRQRQRSLARKQQLLADSRAANRQRRRAQRLKTRIEEQNNNNNNTCQQQQHQTTLVNNNNNNNWQLATCSFVGSPMFATAKQQQLQQQLQHKLSLLQLANSRCPSIISNATSTSALLAHTNNNNNNNNTINNYSQHHSHAHLHNNNSSTSSGLSSAGSSSTSAGKQPLSNNKQGANPYSALSSIADTQQASNATADFSSRFLFDKNKTQEAINNAIKSTVDSSPALQTATKIVCGQHAGPAFRYSNGAQLSSAAAAAAQSACAHFSRAKASSSPPPPPPPLPLAFSYDDSHVNARSLARSSVAPSAAMAKFVQFNDGRCLCTYRDTRSLQLAYLSSLASQQQRQQQQHQQSNANSNLQQQQQQHRQQLTTNLSQQQSCDWQLQQAATKHQKFDANNDSCSQSAASLDLMLCSDSQATDVDCKQQQPSFNPKLIKSSSIETLCGFESNDNNNNNNSFIDDDENIEDDLVNFEHGFLKQSNFELLNSLALQLQQQQPIDWTSALNAATTAAATATAQPTTQQTATPQTNSNSTINASLISSNASMHEQLNKRHNLDELTTALLADLTESLRAQVDNKNKRSGFQQHQQQQLLLLDQQQQQQQQQQLELQQNDPTTRKLVEEFDCLKTSW